MDIKENLLPKKEVSFGGRGKLVYTFEKYTEALGAELAKPIEAALKKQIPEGGVKRFLESIGLVSKNGDILGQVRHVEIKDGDEYFDEKRLEGLERVILRGGVLDEQRLNCKNVTLIGGKHIGIDAELIHTVGNHDMTQLVTKNLIAEDGKLTGDILISGDMLVKGKVTNAGKINVGGCLKAVGNSHLTNVETVGNGLKVQDSAVVEGSGEASSIGETAIVEGSGMLKKFQNILGTLKISGNNATALDIETVKGSVLLDAGYVDGIKNIGQNLAVKGKNSTAVDIYAVNGSVSVNDGAILGKRVDGQFLDVKEEVNAENAHILADISAGTGFHYKGATVATGKHRGVFVDVGKSVRLPNVSEMGKNTKRSLSWPRRYAAYKHQGNPNLKV